MQNYFKFLSSISHHHVWLSFQNEKALFAALSITVYITHDRLHLMTALGSVSDSSHCALLCSGNVVAIEACSLWNCNVKIWCYLMLKQATIWC